MGIARALLLGCLLLAAELHAQPVAPAAREPALVYGVELESTASRDRVLVFADGPVRPQLRELDRGTVMLVFPGAALDPSAPASVPVAPGGTVKKVSVVETAGDAPEVRITILRSAGVSPRMSHRGQQVALDFDRPGLSGRLDADGRPQRTLPARWLDIDVTEAVERLARFVDARLIFDGTLQGSVSIEAIEPLTEREAAAMIDTLLLLKGYVAVASPGGARKILPTATAMGPWVEELAARPDETPLVTLVRLRDIDAELVRQAISPLVGAGGLAQVHARTNSILLAGSGIRLRRLADVIQSLDEAGLRRMILIPLRYADARATSDQLLVAVNDRANQLEVWPDARTNRLVVRGRPHAVQRARDFVDRIDRPFQGTGHIQVIPVRHVDADRLAVSLRALVTQQATSDVQGAASLAGRGLSVSVHRPSRSLVVQADPDTIDIAREIVAELDVPPARVDVEVTFVEVIHSNSLVLAFDAIAPFVEPDAIDDLLIAAVLNPGGNLLSTSGDDGVFGRIAQTPLLIPIIDPATGVPVTIDGIPLTIDVAAKAVVTADETQVHTRLLQRPRLSMISGEEHEIFAGENIPVPVESADFSVDVLQTVQTIERHDTGVRLRIEPTVPAEGPIVLRLELEVSALSGNVTGGPTFLERSLSTTVRLEPGQLAVVGWTSLPGSQRSLVGVPFLSRIPLIGALFRSTTESDASRHLIIAVRAERVLPEAEVLTSWMRRELATGTATGAAAAAP